MAVLEPVLKAVIQYKKRIHEYIKAHPDAQSDDILQDLLEGSLSKEKDPETNTSTMFQPSLPLAKILTEAKPDAISIDLINDYLAKNRAYSKDDLFALLTAYFYYFEDIYIDKELETRKALYNQILFPLRAYREKIERDRALYLIEKSDDVNEHVAAAAYTALAETPVPEDQLDKLVTTLLTGLNNEDGEVRNQASTALGQIHVSEGQRAEIVQIILARLGSDDTGVSLEACISLGRVPIPEHQQGIVVSALLAKLGDDESEEMRHTVCEALGKISIPENQQEAVVSALLAILDNVEVINEVNFQASIALGRVPIPKNQLEATVTAFLARLNDDSDELRDQACIALRHMAVPQNQLETTVTALLTQLNDNNTEIRQKTCKTLGMFPIPKNQLGLVVNALLTRLLHEDFIHSDIYTALGRISIPEDQLEVVVTTLLAGLKNALLVRLKDQDNTLPYYIVYRTQICSALGKTPIPRNQREAVVTALLPELKAAESQFIIIAACESLGQIRIPEKQADAVVTALLTLFDDKRPFVLLEVCKTLGQIPIPEHLKEKVISNLLANLSVASAAEALLAIYKKMLPNERGVLVAKLEGLEDSLTEENPQALIKMKALIQACQSKTVTEISLLQHFPKETVLEITEHADKKLR